MRDILICGTSTRAAAESAARAGFSVTTIDAFADRDQHPAVRALSAGRDFDASPTAAAMARVARDLPCDAVVYLSPFENHPRAVAALAAGRVLLGNAPETLRLVRDPFVLAGALRSHGVEVPRLMNANDSNDSNDSNESNGWLVKPFRSGGGARIREWQRGPIPRGWYLQKRIDGTPGSIVFAAAKGACVPIGFSRQLVGDANFGAAGFRYCGSILAPPGDRQFPDGAAVFEAAGAIARYVSSMFGLAGLNGLDFIARGRVVYPLEVNPRWSSSIEVAERAFAMPFFPVHAAACSDGVLPTFDCAAALERADVVGKAIVYARRLVSVGDTSNWLEDSSVRDVPPSGECFRPGQPVCSVFATAADSETCYRLLVSRAARIYAELEPAARSA
ncbi:MAG: ATP-grasp domain-containing protein [Vicinamibacterales bacterium]